MRIRKKISGGIPSIVCGEKIEVIPEEITGGNIVEVLMDFLEKIL